MLYWWAVRIIIFGFVVAVYYVVSDGPPCYGSLSNEPVYESYCISERGDVYLPPNLTPDECQLIYGVPCP